MSCACGQHKTPQACTGARHLRALSPAQRGRRPKVAVKATRRRGPLCLCGCGRVCLVNCRWASRRCIPHEVRSHLASVARRASAVRQRLRRYKAVLDRLAGRRLTREDLAAVLYEEFRVGYKAHQDAVRRRSQAA